MDLKPSKPIVRLNGIDQALSFELADFAEAERRLNESLIGPGGIVMLFASPLSADVLQKIVFVGLCRKNPRYTLEHVAEWITFENFEEIDAAVAPVLKPLADRLMDRIKRAVAIAEENARNATQEPEEAEDDRPLAGASDGASAAPSPAASTVSVMPSSGPSELASGSTSTRTGAKRSYAKSA